MTLSDRKWFIKGKQWGKERKWYKRKQEQVEAFFCAGFSFKDKTLKIKKIEITCMISWNKSWYINDSKVYLRKDIDRWEKELVWVSTSISSSFFQQGRCHNPIPTSERNIIWVINIDMQVNLIMLINSLQQKTLFSWLLNFMVRNAALNEFNYHNLYNLHYKWIFLLFCTINTFT